MGADLFNLKQLGQEVDARNKRLRSRYARMDYWLQMYLLYDWAQDNKPIGERRFISNDPETIVDTVLRILTRFNTRWMIAADETHAVEAEEGRVVEQVERSLYGFSADIDEDLIERGDEVSRVWNAYQLLVRGMSACKVHLTDKAGRDTNVVYAQYDTRFVMPTYDGLGLDSFIALTPMDADSLAHEYPEAKIDGAPDAQVMKIEVWDKVRSGVAYTQGKSGEPVGWCIAPTEHGFFDKDGKYKEGKLNKLPFVIRYANGVSIRQKPSGAYAFNNGIGEVPSEMRKLLPANNAYEWRTTRRAVAERGRSILASIEKHVPQFNEAVSNLWQAFQLDRFGVYFLSTRGANVPEDVQVALGSGGMVGIERGDSVQKFNPTPTNEAGIRFMDVIQREKEASTVSSVLQATSEFRSGYLQARMEQVALNSIQPFSLAQELWESGKGQMLVDQIKNGGLKKKVTLGYTTQQADSGNRDFKVVDFDPAILKQMPRMLVRGIIEPALPIDMMERAQIANILVNGKTQLVSRSSAQERVLKWQDPQTEADRIWEDIADTDRTVIMMEIAEAAERRGNSSLAQLFRDRSVFAMVVEMAQRMQVQGMLQGAGGGGGNPNQQMGGGRGDTDYQGNGIDNNPAPQQQPPEFRNQGQAQ